MIPSQFDISNLHRVSETIQPSKTYYWDQKSNRIRGWTDGIKAVEQAILQILLTERFEYIIYSYDYGIELEVLIGYDIDYVKADIKRRVSEALLMDDRINEVIRCEVLAITNTKDTVDIYVEVESCFGGVSVRRAVSI